jgi:hypothetical protein
MPELLEKCQQMTNPLYNGPIFRALLVTMDRWVSNGTAPASILPKRRMEPMPRS